MERGSSLSKSEIFLLPIPEEEKKKPLSTVIITIRSHSSYDPLYETLPQEAPDGKVHVWLVPINALEDVKNVIDPSISDATYEESKTLMKLSNDLKTEGIDVVINFECSSGFGDEGFNNEHVLPTTRLSLDRGWIVIFSDFALKALITEWDRKMFGPPPFKKVGEFGSGFILHFSAEVLKQSVSSQLQTVGELCEKGEAHVHALSGTVIYTVNPEAYSAEEYTIEVLTVQTNWDSSFKYPKDTPLCTIDSHSGAAGHCILTYPSGGQLLTSSGHWIELSKLDVSKESILRTAKARYGGEYSSKIEKEISSYTTLEEQNVVMQKYASEWVQKSAPSRKGKW